MFSDGHLELLKEYFIVSIINEDNWTPDWHKFCGASQMIQVKQKYNPAVLLSEKMLHLHVN